MSTKSILSFAAAIATAALALVAAPGTASACGGFFCNQQAIDQTGEHILFYVDGDEIEAHVRIDYEGPSEEFAWIVPTPDVPTVGVSAEFLFTRMTQALSPQFYLNWREIGNCQYRWQDEFDSDGLGSGGGVPTAEDDGDGVTVVQVDSVGPYDFAVLQAINVESLFDWLEQNGYFIPADVMPFVRPYIDMPGNIHFVAFKLSKGNDSGAVQPVTLRYAADKPMIPIQLTAIATQPDMGVYAHVLGDTRAVPENYLHVDINEARIDWLTNGSNYDEVVTEAANEAGGQAFVTEYAGGVEAFENSFFNERMTSEGLDDFTDGAQLIRQLQDRFSNLRGDNSILELMQFCVPKPEELSDVEDRQFYNCPDCYEVALDVAPGCEAAAEERIIAPLRHAQEIFDASSYITRLYTTLSAEEMTVDPVFTFNADIGDYSNIHWADAIVDCGDGLNWDEAPVIIELEDGREVYLGAGRARGGLDDLPAADSWEMIGSSGAPTQVGSNEDEISRGIQVWNVSVQDSVNQPRVSGGGCSVTGLQSALPLGVLGLIGLIGAGNRRRS